MTVQEENNYNDYELAIKSVQCYASHYDYHVEMINMTTDPDILENCPHENVFFKRHCATAYWMEKNEENFDYILFIDADIGVINPCHHIQEFIDDNPEVEITFYDRYFNNEITAGSYLARNSEYSRKFIASWGDYFYKLPKSFHGADNGAIHQVFMELHFDDKESQMQCYDLWNKSKNFNDLSVFEICTRHALGDGFYFCNGKVKIIRKGTHAWSRDGWLTGTEFASKDFMFHGWKKQKLNGEWTWPFKKVEFDLSKCQPWAPFANFVHNRRYVKTDVEIKDKLDAKKEEVRAKYFKSAKVSMDEQTSEFNAISGILKKSARILCWIMTAQKNRYKAFAVNATWAQRCNKVIYITPAKGTGLPSVDLNIPEGRNYLWEKTKRSFLWIYENEIDNYDWFLKADDDTYVVMENLRFMLLPYSPNDPLYFGCKFKPHVRQGYMSGGAGYILSREAIRRFVEEALPNESKCNNTSDGDEDVQMGRCLQNVGVTAIDTRDHNGKHRLLPFSPTAHMEPKRKDALPAGFYRYMYYNYQKGSPNCCSEYLISFHYVNRETMFLIDTLLYHVRPIGFLDEFWKNHLQKTQGNFIIEVLKDLALKTNQPVNEAEITKD